METAAEDEQTVPYAGTPEKTGEVRQQADERTPEKEPKKKRVSRIPKR